jgi:L-ascorbate metabolism protein UlaG (beta-lactamase superfamily)
MAITRKSIPIGANAFKNIDCTTIWWLAGGGFLMNSRGTIIMVDPVISTLPDDPARCETGLPLTVKYPLALENAERADMILYTHSDADHLGPISALALAEKLHPVNAGPPPVFEKLVRLGVDWREITSCRYGDLIEEGAVSVEVIDADHPHQMLSILYNYKPRPFRLGDCCGYIVRTPDGNFLFTGDTRLMEFHLKLKDIHVVALDVSVCQFHLSTLGAIVLANTLEQSIIFPYHYGTFDMPDIPGYNGSPDDVLPGIKNNSRVRVYAPGQPFSMKDGAETTAQPYISNI